MLPRGLRPPNLGPATAAIETAELRYTTAYSNADYVQPLFLLKGTARNAAGRSEPFVISWPALRPEYLLPSERR
jgi:hypothetical protein